MADTYGEMTAFWSAIAQLVPVLGIALVLEARMIARRFGRKKSQARPVTRFLWGMWLFATWGALLLTLGNALVALTREPGRAIEDNGAEVRWAYIAIGNAFFFVAVTPIQKVVAAATLASGVSLRAALSPKIRRSLRQRRAYRADLDYRVGRGRELLHNVLMDAAEYLILAGRSSRLADEGRRHLISDAGTTAERRQLRSSIADADLLAQRSRDRYEERMSTYIRGRKLLADLEDTRRRFVADDEQIAEQLRGADKVGAKTIRRLLSEAGAE
ncbi:hypothetical protein ACFC1I_15955 [Microbacterium sp. NPDC056044]|uniref:hypothetical protein n=1 Tax=Microbacterium sp. NPDC056044 TaxID=3345690 RepID=UPI0035E262F9